MGPALLSVEGKNLVQGFHIKNISVQKYLNEITLVEVKLFIFFPAFESIVHFTYYNSVLQDLTHASSKSNTNCEIGFTISNRTLK